MVEYFFMHQVKMIVQSQDCYIRKYVPKKITLSHPSRSFMPFFDYQPCAPLLPRAGLISRTWGRFQTSVAPLQHCHSLNKMIKMTWRNQPKHVRPASYPGQKKTSYIILHGPQALVASSGSVRYFCRTSAQPMLRNTAPLVPLTGRPWRQMILRSWDPGLGMRVNI